MKPVISVQFDQNAHGVYYSGQIVSGKVELRFPTEKYVRAIILNVIGLASAEWSERRIHGRRRRRRRVSGKEIYVSSCQHLYGSNIAPVTTISSGVYTYNFVTQLPVEIPSSFESRYGHIRYVVEVCLDKPKRFRVAYKKAFTVLRERDLNFESPNLRQPATVNHSKSFWIGLMTATPLNITASIPQSGFVPGQIIPIHTEINNTSNINATSVCFSLRQLITYSAETPYATTKVHVNPVVSARSLVQIGPKSTILLDESLLIPALPPTSPLYARIIRITYDVLVEVVVSGLHRNGVATIPVVIGTVPLIGIPNKQIEMEPVRLQVRLPEPEPDPLPSTSLTTFNIVEDNREQDAMAAFNLPPPSYEEAILMEVSQVVEDEGEEPHTTQQHAFTPRYPVYNSIPMVSNNPYVAENTTKEKLVPI